MNKMYLVSSSLSDGKLFHVKAKSSLRAAYKYSKEFGYLINSEVTKDPGSHTGKMYKISNTDQSSRYDYVKVERVNCFI